MNADELGGLCIRATTAGPRAFADLFVDAAQRWAVGLDGPAAADLGRQPESLPPLVRIPVKLGALAAAQLAAVGTLVASAPSGRVGVSSLARGVIEGCSAVAWVLDDGVSSDVRHRRAWLIWAVAEGNAASTAAVDAGRTGAMCGSPQRLTDLDQAIFDQLGVHIERSDRSKPKDWRLDGVFLPGARALTVSAVGRWFPGADGGTLYSQVSRQAHSDVLVALALVDETLAIPEGEGLGVVATALAFWAQAWNHVLSYLGLESEVFDDWLTEMLTAIGRHDLADLPLCDS